MVGLERIFEPMARARVEQTLEITAGPLQPVGELDRVRRMYVVIDETVNDTPNPAIRRVDLAVGDARDPSRVLTRLTAYVSQ